MRIGYLDLPSGLSGDMFLGALAGAGAPLEVLQEAVQRAAGPRLSLRESEVTRAGLRGTRVQVLLDGKPLREPGGPAEDGGGTDATPPAPVHASHRSYTEVVDRLRNAALEPPVGDDALRVFRLLGEAEARRHGVKLESVHFHEVGSLDAIADVVGVAAGVHALGLRRLLHGPVAVGGGTVETSHGRLPVPAPATLALLEGRALRMEEGVGELTTPTGAALLAALARPAPAAFSFRPERTGYGAGSKDPSRRPNLARLVVGEATEGVSCESGASSGRQHVAVVEASLDDCTPEEGGHLLTAFLEEGALDVTLTPLIMKKGRPGFLIRILAPAEEGPRVAQRLTRMSSTLGARWRVEERCVLERRVDRVRLPDGEVRVKVAVLPGGAERPHPEHEDVARMARARGVSWREVHEEVERAWRGSR